MEENIMSALGLFELKLPPLLQDRPDMPTPVFDEFVRRHDGILPLRVTGDMWIKMFDDELRTPQDMDYHNIGDRQTWHYAFNDYYKALPATHALKKLSKQPSRVCFLVGCRSKQDIRKAMDCGYLEYAKWHNFGPKSYREIRSYLGLKTADTPSKTGIDKVIELLEAGDVLHATAQLKLWNKRYKRTLRKLK